MRNETIVYIIAITHFYQTELIELYLDIFASTSRVMLLT